MTVDSQETLPVFVTMTLVLTDDDLEDDTSALK